MNTWSSSNRRSQLPPNWPSLRLQRFAIDNWTCVDCDYRDDTQTGIGLECDHIGDPLDHSLDQLRTRCTTCHAEHTKQQAAEGRAAHAAKRRPPARRHPGLLS